MPCQECLSVCVCADSTLYSMYKSKAEKCPFLKDKNKLSEVVRCKGCDYSIKMDSSGNYRCLVLKGIMRGRDFCSYGRLKGDE